MIKSQDDLPTCNDGKRSSDVLLATIDELEKVKKENEELKYRTEVYYRAILIMFGLSILGILMELAK